MHIQYHNTRKIAIYTVTHTNTIYTIEPLLKHKWTGVTFQIKPCKVLAKKLVIETRPRQKAQNQVQASLVESSRTGNSDFSMTFSNFLSHFFWSQEWMAREFPSARHLTRAKVEMGTAALSVSLSEVSSQRTKLHIELSGSNAFPLKSLK